MRFQRVVEIFFSQSINNPKRLLVNNNLNHSSILNSTVTIHDLNTIYQVICTFIEGNGKLRHPT